MGKIYPITLPKLYQPLQHITALSESFRMAHANQCLTNSQAKSTKRSLVSQYFTKSSSSFDSLESDSRMSESPVSSSSEKKIRAKKWKSVPQRQNPSARIPYTLFLRDQFRSGCSVFLTHFHSDHYKGLTKKFIGDIFGKQFIGASIFKRLPRPATWWPKSFPSPGNSCIRCASENTIIFLTAKPAKSPR